MLLWWLSWNLAYAAPGTVVYLEDSLPTSFNPLYPRTMVDVRAHELVFDRLYAWSALAGDWRSRLVTNLEPLDARTVRLTLTTRARWHDGEKVDANDVCFTVAAIRDPDTLTTLPHRRFLGGCVVDDLGRAVVTLRQPSADPREQLDFPVLPRHNFMATAIRPDHPFGAAPVGSGPMVATLGKRNVRFRAHDSPHVHPQIESMALEVGGDPLVQVKVALSGGVHGLIHVPTPGVDALAAAERVALYPYSTRQIWFIACNPSTLPEPDLRAAIDAAIDRVELLERGGHKAANGSEVGAALSSGPFLAGSPYQSSGIVPKGRADRDAVALHLAAMGASVDTGTRRVLVDGSPIVLRIGMLAELGGEVPELLPTLSRQLGAAGFGTELFEVSTEDFWAAADGAKALPYDLLVAAWPSGKDLDLDALFHSRVGEHGARNLFAYNNPEVDGLLTDIHRAGDEAERTALYWELHGVLTEDRPYLFLWTLSEWSAWDRSLEGVIITPWYYFTDIEHWRVRP